MFVPEPSTHCSVQGELIVTWVCRRSVSCGFPPAGEGAKQPRCPLLFRERATAVSQSPAFQGLAYLLPRKQRLPWHEAGLEALLEGGLGDTSCRGRGPKASRLGFQTMLHGWWFCNQSARHVGCCGADLKRGGRRSVCFWAVAVHPSPKLLP